MRLFVKMPGCSKCPSSTPTYYLRPVEILSKSSNISPVRVNLLRSLIGLTLPTFSTPNTEHPYLPPRPLKDSTLHQQMFLHTLKNIDRHLKSSENCTPTICRSPLFSPHKQDLITSRQRIIGYNCHKLYPCAMIISWLKLLAI